MASVTIAWMSVITICFLVCLSSELRVHLDPFEDTIIGKGVDGISEGATVINLPSGADDQLKTSDMISQEVPREPTSQFKRFRPSRNPSKLPPYTVRQVWWAETIHRFRKTWKVLGKRARKLWRFLRNTWARAESHWKSLGRTQEELQHIVKTQEKVQLEGGRQEVTALIPTRRSTATTLTTLGQYIQNYYHAEPEHRDPFMRLSIITFFNNILATSQPQRRQFEHLIGKAQSHQPIRSSETWHQHLATPHADLSLDPDHNQADIVEEVLIEEFNGDTSLTQTKPATDIEIISNPDPAQTLSKKLEFLASHKKNLLEEIVEVEEPKVEGAKETSDSENSASITVFKKTFPPWFPMGRFEGRRGAKQHHQNIDYDKMLHLKKPTRGGLLSDDIAHRLPISPNNRHSESTGSAKILDPVEVSEIVEELKRSEAEATNYIIDRLESDGAANSISKFIGPYKIKRIESSVAQQIQAVDVIYWLAYRGELEAQKVLKSKLASGGLEKSVETRINQALELLAENDKVRQTLLSDFADAGPPVSKKHQLINQVLTRINRGFSLSSAFSQALDVGKGLTMRGLCRLFAPATNLICRTVSTELSRLGVDPFRRSSSFAAGTKPLHLYDFPPFPVESTRRPRQLARSSTFDLSRSEQPSQRPPFSRSQTMRYIVT